MRSPLPHVCSSEGRALELRARLLYTARMDGSGTCSYCHERPSAGALRVDRWIGLGKNVEFRYCSDGCRANIEAAALRVKRGTPWFLAGIVLLLLLVPAVIFLPLAVDLRLLEFVPAGLTILAGALILGFPLIASNVVQTLGIQAAQRLARVAGAVMMLAGAGLYFLLHFTLPGR